MREPDSPAFGLLAEFDSAERLVDSVGRAHSAGFRQLDAYSPFPIEKLTEALGADDPRIPWLTLAGGIIGAAVGFGMQVATNLLYPIDIGGRPLVATPAFMMITFELTVLGAGLFSAVGMLLRNRLPRLNHPLFDVPRFNLASSDRFFLLVSSHDPRFDPQATRDFLESLDPVHIDLVEQRPEPA
jgi:hypothetical protein